MATCDYICNTKLLSILIWNLTIPNTWCAKNETFGNGISCVAHHKKGFLAFDGLTCRRWKSKLQLIFHNIKHNIIIGNGLTKAIIFLVIVYLANLYINDLNDNKHVITWATLYFDHILELLLMPHKHFPKTFKLFSSFWIKGLAWYLTYYEP
jgi:hypothetical protein